MFEKIKRAYRLGKEKTDVEWRGLDAKYWHEDSTVKQLRKKQDEISREMLDLRLPTATAFFIGYELNNFSWCLDQGGWPEYRSRTI